MASDWKHSFVNEKNMKVTVDMEMGVSPWTPIFKLQFKMKPTALAQERFDDDRYDFLKWLADNILGLKVLKKETERVVPTGWAWHGVYYGLEHNPQKFKFDQWSDFEIQVFVIAPDRFETGNDWKSLKKETETLSKKFAGLKIFQNSRDLEFKR